MAFRADEAAERGRMEVANYLIPSAFSVEDRQKSEMKLDEIIAECGPVVAGYPTWHPLVRFHDGRLPQMYPGRESGYEGLDHTRYFAHGFVTCPYGDGQKVIDSVKKLEYRFPAEITAERLDVKFYNDNATPILVRVEWEKPLETGKLIPKRLAVPLMLEQEVPCWTWGQRAERWERMRPYLLGEPHGNRSSLFVSQDTALAMKKIYLSLVETGMFGPLKMG